MVKPKVLSTHFSRKVATVPTETGRSICILVCKDNIVLEYQNADASMLNIPMNRESAKSLIKALTGALWGKDPE